MSAESGTHLVHFSRLELVMPFISYFENIGVDTTHYWANVGLKKSLFVDATNPIPIRLFFHVLNAICRDYAIEDPGLIVGKNTSLYMLGDFGRQLMNAEDVRKYLEDGCRLISSRSSGDYYWLEEGEEEVQFCIALSGIEESDKIQNYLYIMLITINTIRQVLGKEWCPRRFTIPRLSTSTASGVSAILPDTILLRRGNYACFTIPLAAMNTRMPSKSTVHPRYLIASDNYQKPVDFIDSMRKLIRTLILTGRIDIAVAARASGMSERKLQRRLSSYGTTYSSMVAETRVALARRWIEEEHGSIAVIAKSLGYSSPANFSRTFRRVTGMSPTQYKSRSD